MALKPTVVVSGRTDVGKVRKNNEDNYKYLGEGADFWAAVADGCGGEAAGEVASAIAIKTFTDEIGQHRLSKRDISFIMRDAICNANKEILKEAQVDGRNGMGTTFSSIFFRGKNVVIAHVGDSRIYRIRAGEFKQLTKDHTWLSEAIASGKMTEEEAEKHPRAGWLLRAVGMPDFTSPDIDFLDSKPGDIYLLSSDGLHRCMTKDEIAVLMKEEPEAAVNKLIDLALERGSPDNVTVITFRIDGYEDFTEAPPPAPAPAV